MIICIHCHAYVPDESLVMHMRWHETQTAVAEMAHAHQENLIERMHAAEKKIEALGNRVHLVERNHAPGQMF